MTNLSREKLEAALKNKLSQLLAEHSINDCPRCFAALETPDLNTEDAIIDLFWEYLEGKVNA